jgi:hypothetical protein
VREQPLLAGGLSLRTADSFAGEGFEFKNS